MRGRLDKYRNVLKTPFSNATYRRRIETARRKPGNGAEWNKRVPDPRQDNLKGKDAVTTISIRLLTLLDKMAESLGLTVFLAYGTLIGAVRHQGFIPWDDDIDVFMTRDDFHTLIDHAQDIPEEILLLPMGPHFFKFMDGGSIVSLDGKRGIAVDIFMLDEAQDQELMFYNVHTLMNQAYDRNAFFPAERAPFEQSEFAIPRDHSRILSDIYGDYMKLPDPEQQHAPHMDYSSIQIGAYGSKLVNPNDYRGR
jgi:hypothetical protein